MKNEAACEAWGDFLEKQMHIEPVKRTPKNPLRQEGQENQGLPKEPTRMQQQTDNNSYFNREESPIKTESKMHQQNEGNLKSG